MESPRSYIGPWNYIHLNVLNRTELPLVMTWRTIQPQLTSAFYLLQLELTFADCKIWQQTFQITLRTMQ